MAISRTLTVDLRNISHLRTLGLCARYLYRTARVGPAALPLSDAPGGVFDSGSSGNNRHGKRFTLGRDPSRRFIR
jgi:hypothetical protein